MDAPVTVHLQSSRAGTVAPARRARAQRVRPPDPPSREPPRDGGGGGGGEGEGGLSAGGDDDLGRFALALVLIGITTLFAVVVAVALLLRRRSDDWRPAEVPEALDGLWLSTALLLACSVCLEVAARRAKARPGRAWLGAGLVLGVAFLAAQTRLWLAIASAGLVPASSGYAAVFFCLTGLHALHVLGGLAFVVYLIRPRRWREGADPGARGVRTGALYWHYMGVVWAAIFVLLRFSL